MTAYKQNSCDYFIRPFSAGNQCVFEKSMMTEEDFLLFIF